MTSHSLLFDPAICNVAAKRRCRASLPEVLALLSTGEIESFPALRPHQAPAWHQFLVQLAALACHAARTGEPFEDAAAWREALLALTPEWPGGEAFTLVVDDVTRPAFLQAPLADAADFASFRNVLATPDALDLLVTSKNHDLKAERMTAATPEHWVFALVALQTQEGIMGAGKYGISRMNGGYGSRPFLGVRPPGGPGRWFRRDVVRLLAARSEILENFAGFAKRRAVGLVWTEPWDGMRQLGIDELDPFYIEICRRLRLSVEDGIVVARDAGSKAARIAAKELKGATGDPWAPIAREERKVFSVTADGFDYRRMVSLLDGSKYQRPPLAMPDQSDAAEGLAIVAAALARGQGKTEGFHTRTLPVSKEVASLLGRPAAAHALAQLGQRRVGEVGNFYARVLRGALFQLFQGGPEEIDWRKDSSEAQAQPWRARYNARIDRIFFAHLFDAFAAEQAGDFERKDELEQRWRESVRGIGRDVLYDAIAAAPRKAATWHRARARALGFFEAQARIHLDLPIAASAAEEPADDQPRAS